MKRFMATFAMCLAMVLAGCSAPSEQPKPGLALDRLFNQLRATSDRREAHRIEIAIRHAWASSGRPLVDAMVLHGIGAMNDDDCPRAIGFFTRAVALAPDFAEAYNLRATCHFMEEDYGAAITDIKDVLVREPRHFAALMGLGHVFLSLGSEKAAAHAYEAALAINPHLEAARAHLHMLRARAKGVPI